MFQQLKQREANSMFKEGTDWDSEACGFRPATERAQEERKHLREQIHTLTEIWSKIIYQLDTPISRSSFCCFIMMNTGEAQLCYS